MTDLVTLGFKADTRGLTTAQSELNKTAKAGGKLDSQMSAAQKTLGAVGVALGALGISASTNQLIKYTDTWSSLNTQLKQVTGSENELVSVRSQLLDISRDTRIELSATVGLYAEMTRGVSDLNVSSGDLLGITKTLNNLFLAGGKPLSEMTGAIRQLNQGFASGVLRGDEFNSVAEGAPRIMDALSASLGKTRGELREFAATGGITAEIMVNALREYEQTATRLAETVEMTFEQSMQVATTNITEFIGESQGLNSSISALGFSIVSISENLEPLSDSLKVIAAIVGASLTPKFIAYSAALGHNVKMQLLANTAATKTANALGVVTTRAASATVATNALGVATRFMLGPWGLLITALGTGAAAFAMSSSRMDDATNAAKSHADEVSRLERIYSEMNAQQVTNEYINLQQQAMALSSERIKLETKLERVLSTSSMGGSVLQVAELRAEIRGLAEDEQALNDQLNVMNTLLDKARDSFEWEEPVKETATAVMGLSDEMLRLIDTLDPASAKLRDYEKNWDLIIGAVADGNLSVERSIELLNELDKTMEDVGGADNGLTDLASEIDNFGGAWTRTGNAVVDAFGGMSEAIGDYSHRMSDLSKLQVKLDKEKQKSGADGLKLAELQSKINEERVAAELSGYRSLASGAAGMFSEKTAAYKAFSAINQVLSIAEIALSYQKIAASGAETAAVVANEGTKQSANALTAISAAFAAPFPVGFVAGAAMIGVMTSLLGESFGGGGAVDPTQQRQDTQGTGTALGSDAKSQSILNSQDRFEDLQVDQLFELRGIKSSIDRLSVGVNGLSAEFSRNSGLLDFQGDLSDDRFGSSGVGKILSGEFLGLDFGGLGERFLTGLFGKTTQKVIDSGIFFVQQTLGTIISDGIVNASAFFDIETEKKKLFGLSKSSRVSTETQDIGQSIQEQMARIFGFVGDAVVTSANSLGIDTVELLKSNFVGPLSLSDLAEMEKGLNGAFSDTFSFVTKSLNDALNNYVIDIGRVSLEGLDGAEREAELQAIFSAESDKIAEYLVPAIKQYQQVGEGAFDTLTRVAQEQAVFNDALERTSMSLSGLSSALKIDVGQAIISLVGGAEKFSELSNSFFESFFSESEQLANLEGSLSDVFGSLGLSLTDTRSGFKDLVSGLDVTNEADQRLYATLLQLSPAMDDYLGQLEDLANNRLSMQIELLKLQGNAEQALAMERQRELLSINASLRPLQETIWRQQELNKARADEIAALDEMQDTLKSNVAFAETQLEQARQAEVDRINETVRGATTAYNATVESINAQRAAYSQLISDLELAANGARSALNDSLNAELSKYDDLISAAQDSSSQQISAINDVSSARLSALNSERAVVAGIANQLGAASKSVTASQALTAARGGNFELAGRIESGSFNDATSARLGAAREAFALNEIGKLADAQLSDIDRSIASTERSGQRQIDAINQASALEVAELESQKEGIEQQVKTLLGIDDSVLSLDVAMAQYQSAQDALQREVSSDTLTVLQSQEDASLRLLEQAEASAQEQINALNAQVDTLLSIDNSVLGVTQAIEMLAQERQQLAQLDYDNQRAQIEAQYATLTAIENSRISTKPPADDGRTDNERILIIKELQALRKEQEVANAQIASNTSKSAKEARTTNNLLS